jgi:hypothetical protein
MKTVADYLKNAPKGTKLYSPICGECTLHYIDDIDISVTNGEHYFYFNHLGQYNVYEENVGECLLFPSKDVREWDNYQLPCDFKPFDKVVVRDGGLWHIDFFERYDPSNKEFPYECMHQSWKHCLPFNEETAKLIGTKDGGACAG